MREQELGILIGRMQKITEFFGIRNCMSKREIALNERNKRKHEEKERKMQLLFVLDDGCVKFFRVIS